MNAAKSGTGVWERKFLGLRLDRQGRIGIAPESIERFKEKVWEMWRPNQSRTGNQLRDDWKSYAQGWWGYYRPGGNTQTTHPAGRLDSKAHSEVFLDSMA